IIALCAALIIWWTELHTLFTGAETFTSERASRADIMCMLLVGVSAGLIGLCEVIFLRDVFAGGPFGALAPTFRMNTVFKFYYQVWLLLGIASGPLLVWLLAAVGRAAGAMVALLVGGGAAAEAVTAQAAEEPVAAPALALAGGGADDSLPDEHLIVERSSLGATDAPPLSASAGALRPPAGGVARALALGGAGLWSVAFVWLLLAAMIYPTMAVAARSQNLSAPRSLDGTAYMAQDSMNMGDAQAIDWLNAHVSGDPVIVEAALYNEYTHLGRVSAFTGLPTLIGWGGHEEQWRFNWLAQPGRANVLGERLNAVKLIYTNDNDAFVLSLLHSYRVSYVYVGAAERQTYGQYVDHFASFLKPVYSQAGVTIYAVPGAPAG
ncbi:MAG: DUF2298 domain-containing protein, partial [Ktedonobacterales bacterium]